MIFSESGLLLLLHVTIYFKTIDGYTTEKLFPENFMFGVGSSAYQTEGSWSDDGKGENIWDHYISSLSKNITDISNESYKRFKDDVALIADMKLKFYKFSLSWSRILPSGFNDSINQEGIAYYKNLIEELERQNITPIVTIYQWDLPQVIQNLGGWTNSSNIKFFVDYARVAFENFKTVKYWLTMHEPKQICRGGYGDASLAPFISRSGDLDYKCAYVVLKAHAAVYRMYQAEFQDLEGKISIALDGSWSIPVTDSRNDNTAANRRIAFEFGLYADPIFRIRGNWPNTVIQIVNQGRLPVFSNDEILEIRGTADFMALNYYEARMVQYFRLNSSEPSYEQDLRMNISKNSSWTEGANGFAIVPWSIRSFLNYVKTEYRNPEIIITGNGVADDGSLQDSLRTNYMADHLSNILDAIHIDQVNVTGYIFWSLLDSFEWTDGYNLHFGLYSVDRNSINKTRIAKDSSKFYQKVATEFKISTSNDFTTSPSATVVTSTEKPQTDSTITELSTSAGRTTTTTTVSTTSITAADIEVISEDNTNTFSGSTVIIFSYVVLVVSITFLIFFSNGMFVISSFSKSFAKIV
uniref:Putative glycosyl hydrolase n=1 Tax=Chrysomela lapponica TaxID=153811 RepID=A0A0B5EF73_CHRLA|nr:putative glycosyl hydrolase [Chrysomela lapponica]